jgi:hypothetical protein
MLILILNVGKIVSTFKMDENLRVEAGRAEPEIQTIRDFSRQHGDFACCRKNAMAPVIMKLPSAGRLVSQLSRCGGRDLK